MPNTRRRPDSLFLRGLIALAAWCAITVALLVIAARGPRWSAYQEQPNASHALAIIGIGQLFALAIGWPIFTRSWATVIGIAIVLPIAIRTAGSIAGSSTLPWIELAAKLEIALGLFATIWAIAPRCGVDRRMVWSGLLAITLGSSILPWLTADFDARDGLVFHFSPLQWLTTTFLHD